MSETLSGAVPGWVPEGAKRYLAHTECGRSIRELARRAGCHASTVMRQIRRIETRRDDPLVDAALAALAARCPSQEAPAPGAARRGGGAGQNTPGQGKPGQGKSDQGKPGQNKPGQGQGGRPPDRAAPAPARRADPTPEPAPDPVSELPQTPDSATLEREACRVLRRLGEPGAVLAVAEGMEKAVVVRDDIATGGTRTATVERSIAQAMALKDWIACARPGRISRYHITAAGRAALGRMLAEAENRARAGREGGFAEAQAGFDPGAPRAGAGSEGARPRRNRYGQAESPLTLLARRRDRDGRPFLDERLVRAGERLREDFELAQMGAKLTQNWDRLLGAESDPAAALDPGPAPGPAPGPTMSGSGPAAARVRLQMALRDLGPGLSDVALRCCCYLEGLEQAEKRMGWSARSGKIVLRIALQRLARHYEEDSGPPRMIG